jgi:mlo protein
MLMGFISLLLAVGQTPISKICIPAKAGNIMLPCKLSKKHGKGDRDDGDGHRRLLWLTGQEAVHRRFLVGAAGGDDYCGKKVPTIERHPKVHSYGREPEKTDFSCCCRERCL